MFPREQSAVTKKGYFLSELTGPQTRPHTTTIMAVAMAVGHMVGMYWKDHYKIARPVQLFPALNPLITTPGHPTYPSNHSLQAHLIAHALGSVFSASAKLAMAVQLFAMAARIAENREIAGVHFPDDSDAGEELASDIFPLLDAVPSFVALQDLAKEEWLTLGDPTEVPQRRGVDSSITK